MNQMVFEDVLSMREARILLHFWRVEYERWSEDEPELKQEAADHIQYWEERVSPE